MSCPHGNPIGGCDTCDEVDAAFEAGKRSAMAEQPARQEPVAFYVYKPTLPRGNLGSVSDGDLPWVYDQDSSSGFSARMLVTPITSPPAQRKPLTDDEIESINVRLSGKRDLARLFARAIEAAHGIKE